MARSSEKKLKPLNGEPEFFPGKAPEAGEGGGQ